MQNVTKHFKLWQTINVNNKINYGTLTQINLALLHLAAASGTAGMKQLAERLGKYKKVFVPLDAFPLLLLL